MKITFRKVVGVGLALVGALLIGVFLFPPEPTTFLPLPLHTLDTKWHALDLPQQALSVIGSVETDQTVLIMDVKKIAWSCNSDTMKCASTGIACEVVYNCGKDLPKTFDLGDTEYRRDRRGGSYDPFQKFPGQVGVGAVAAARMTYVYWRGNEMPPTYKHVGIDANGRVWMSKVQGDDGVGGALYLMAWGIGAFLCLLGIVILKV